jgi:hypothetical protein
MMATLILGDRLRSLKPEEFCIATVPADQLLVSAFVGDLAAFQDDDLVGMLNRREAVRDDYDGPVGTQLFDGLGD